MAGSNARGARPNAIIAGAQKCGTTTLHHLLARHPDVFFPGEPQEIHFFDLDENFARGLAWYESLFRGWNGQAIVCQKSPLYLYDERVPDRILAALGREVRLLFILRHPAERAYSHYWHEVRLGHEPLDFVEALAREPLRLQAGYRARRHYSYLDRGRYATQLQRFYDRFPGEAILVVLHDDLKRDSSAVVYRCLEFLGLDARRWRPPQAGADLRKNAARLPRSRRLQAVTGALRRPGLQPIARMVDRVNLVPRRYPPMAPALRQRITETLVGEIERLGPLTGVDVSAWLKKEEATT